MKPQPSRTPHNLSRQETYTCQEVLDNMAMDVDKANMDFSNAYIDTEVDHINVGIQPQGLGKEAEVKVVYRRILKNNRVVFISWNQTLCPQRR